MKNKLKKILLPFILLIIVNQTSVYIAPFFEFGVFNAHVGVLFLGGLLFGPYGAAGAILANLICDLSNGYGIILSLSSAIFSFGVSYLAFKIWYSNYDDKHEVTKPRLDNIYHVTLFISDMMICAAIYSVVHGIIAYLVMGSEINSPLIASQYFFNFINIAFIFGIISIWISKRIDFIHTPKTSKKTVNKKLYKLIFSLLIISTIFAIFLIIYPINNTITLLTIVIIGILLLSYLTKPFEYEIHQITENRISEKVMTIFLRTTIIIIIIATLLPILITHENILNYDFIYSFIPATPILIIADLIIILFFIPGFYIMRYLEKKVITPIVSFSQIEEFVKENEKIESEKLIEIYSKYINENDEIGTLSRCYSELIEYNNRYIENIREIEGEKERIKAELDIATRIQASNLPTAPIENNEIFVNGQSYPAKEVGGDFFDYYMLDNDNVAIVIGDASGKGVPAALLSTITQVMIKQILKHERNPSKVLYSLNNQLCENNAETMFITLWLGIYNKNTKIITFSNAGHNPPLIKENDNYYYLNEDKGIVLGIMDDFEFVKEEMTVSQEIVLYTDGITDANNNQGEMYGENRLLNFFNEFKKDTDPIKELLTEINSFTEDSEQFDDMTILYLKIKND